jgi:hypothetical protein
MMFTMNAHNRVEDLCSRCRSVVLKDLLQLPLDDDSLTDGLPGGTLDSLEEDSWRILDRNHDADFTDEGEYNG